MIKHAILEKIGSFTNGGLFIGLGLRVVGHDGCVADAARSEADAAHAGEAERCGHWKELNHLRGEQKRHVGHSSAVIDTCHSFAAAY